jgi:hypothetical protein
MDGDKLQNKVYAGYAKAAKRIGLMHNIYRPAGTDNPITASTLIDSTYAHFTPSGNYTQFNSYGNSTWQAMLDGNKVSVGDYLVGEPGTFFIASKQKILPIMAVSCNRTVSLTQGGVSAVAINWPASVLKDAVRGDITIEEIPGNPANPSWMMLMPEVNGITPEVADLVSDELLRVYLIDSAEISDLGWRIVMKQSSLLTTSVIQHYATVINLIGKIVTFRHMSFNGFNNPETNPVEGNITVSENTNSGSSTISLTSPIGKWMLVAGDKFIIAGDTTTYTVQANSITDVSISPALVASATAGTSCTFTWKNDYEVKILINKYETKLIDNTVIFLTDSHVLMGTMDTSYNLIPVPTNLDKILFDTYELKIISSINEYAGDIIAVFDIQARA